MSANKPVYNPYMGIARALIAQRCRKNQAITVEFIATVWPAIVGSELSKRTHPVKLTPDKIVIAVPSELWRREMSGPNRQRLLDQVNHFIPESLSALNLVIGTKEMFPNHKKRSASKKVKLGELPEDEAELLDEMNDPELRDILSNIRRLQLGRKS